MRRLSWRYGKRGRRDGRRAQSEAIQPGRRRLETRLHRRRDLHGHPRRRKVHRDEGVQPQADHPPALGRRELRQEHRTQDRSPLKIVVADDLPASALELIRAEASWVVDARSGRTPDALAADLTDADAIMVR